MREMSLIHNMMPLLILTATCVANSSDLSNLKTIPGETAFETEGIERVQVTGSRIKRIDFEGASPILSIDREEMERTGYNSIADVLRELTVNSFGSYRPSSHRGAPGAANVNLRGLGAARTLVLIDGKRVQKDIFKNSVDLNLIPFAAVERIEVLKG